jgi:nucleoside-diphosphate-sugar epimerase
MNTLHVIIGTGPLGMSVMEALVPRGVPIRMVNRSGRADVPRGVTVVAADILNADSLRGALAGAAVVYQCAQPAYHRWPQEFPALQRAVLEAAAQQGARVVLGDNLYMYGISSTPLTEQSPMNATTRKGRVRAQMAEEAMAFHRSGRAQVTAARGSDFFGPRVGESALGERVLGSAVTHGTAQLLGNPDIPHAFTFIGDFGLAMATLGQDGRAFGRAWHVPVCATVTPREVLKRAERLLGHPIRTSVMAPWMLKAAGLFIPGARETVEMLPVYAAPYRVDDSAFCGTFGLTATPLDDALARTLASYARSVTKDAAVSPGTHAGANASS